MSSPVFPSNDPSLKSWIESANDPGGDFPVQNLPMGVFARRGPDEPLRVGVAIGDRVLDLAACWDAGLFAGTPAEGENVFARESLNAFFAMGQAAWSAVRQRVSNLLRADTPTLRDDAELRAAAVVAMPDAEMRLPVEIGDYTDFYASIHHATNVGSLFRPDNPLLPNYKHIPIGYHGRASSIVLSGTPVRRPHGQIRPDESKPPIFAPVRSLDYELELGFFVGPGNAMGRRLSVAEAEERIFGMVLVNDWSARDVQKWEYQPLGPFNAKNFATTISPWVVAMDALAPFRVPGPPRKADDPAPLEYLQPASDFGLDIVVEALLRTRAMRERGAEPFRLSRGSFRDMYWTPPQMLAHHTSTGCNMRPGDLLASGTISGPGPEARGCLLELTMGGKIPVSIPGPGGAEERRFLHDGDEVILRAHCEREGSARIGFGECRAEVLPAD